MKSLITGIHGFVGSHMEDYLKSINHEVIAAPRIIEAEFLKQTNPDYIFHFAGFSSNIDSFTKPKEAFEINLMGTLKLYTETLKAKIFPKILFAGSSEEYHLQNPYAVSKMAASSLSSIYAKTYNLNIVRTRSFNQEGPRRQERYVISSLAKQVAEIEMGLKKPFIAVGNLGVSRDFVDVRDSVRAYLLLLEKGESGEVYDVCSGELRKIKDLLELLISFSKVKDITIKIDKDKIRFNEPQIFYGSITKLKKITGWEPRIPIEKTLLDTLNYWRGVVTK